MLIFSQLARWTGTGQRTVVLGLIFAGYLCAQVNVLTYHNDLARTGQNLNETVLTKAAVSSSQFGKLFSDGIDGYAYAQPLYVTGVNIAGKGVHNVVYVATEHDGVYAFDADQQGDPLWQVSFLNAAAGVTSVPAQNTSCSQIVPELGITGTPVIDPATETLYVVAMTLENGSYAQRLHALDITSGAERAGSPVLIQATYHGTGEGGSTLTFNPKNYKQRPGLLLLNGVVYTSWSSHCDIGTYHGWLMGYDARTLQQVVVYNNTPNGNEGSFWASGAAPAADAGGNIYLVAGNGTFDANTSGPDLGEAFIKLSTAGGLSVADWFVPFNAASLNSRDLDIGSSGAVLLPEEAGSPQHPHLMVSAGKEGRIYLVDRDNLGKFQANSDSQIPQSILGQISPLFSIPAYYQGSVYFGGSGDNLKAFSIREGQLSATPVSQSAAKFGSPGAVPSISANGAADGIVWVTESTGGGRLHAYDASDLSKELFNSSGKAANSLGSFVKFSTPTIVNGKVYAATQTALVAYGLTGAGASAGVGAVVNGATFQPGAAAPGSIISIFGSFPAGAQAAQSAPLPVSLGGVSVTVNNTPAPLYYVSGTQINAQVPFETVPGGASLTVNVNGTPLGPVNLTVQPDAPGLFTIGSQAAVQNQDGGVNSVSNPARAGSVVTAYLTGQGMVSPPIASGAAGQSKPLSNVIASVQATVGGQAAQVQFAGLSPGLVGVFQVNLTVPQLAAGRYPLAIQVGTYQSNAAGLSVAP